jgi:RNA polymerase sigma-70 factor (ECF subfamily)
MSFAEQLERARSGDPKALDDLLARWRPLLRLQADQLLGRDLSARVDPSDVVQEVWAQAFANLNQFRGATVGERVNWLRRLVARRAGSPVRLPKRLSASRGNARQALALQGRVVRLGDDAYKFHP